MFNSLESSNTHQAGDLADGNCDRRAGHETAYGRSGKETDDPTDSKEAYGKDDKPLG